MSSLFKSGYLNFNALDTTPYVIDGNTKVISPVNTIGEKNEKASDDSMTAEKTDGADAVKSKAFLDDAVNEAERIKAAAEDEAERIIEAAQAQADEIKENAYKAGFEQGVEEGSSEGQKRADEYLANIKKEQEELAAKLDEENDAYLRDAEHKLVDFTCAMVEKITGILIDDYKPVMFNMINNALNEAEASLKYTIKICEDSYYYVEDNKERIVGAANPNITIDIFSDPKLEKGQCTIETDNGIIDLSMDIQIQNLITAFKMLS
ncbi:MAG: hypothetical protein IJ053_02615 [Lachnospiraceae bacterium]|nr:hypothetical protein [Lachnospiraceae bacterium]